MEDNRKEDFDLDFDFDNIVLDGAEPTGQTQHPQGKREDEEEEEPTIENTETNDSQVVEPTQTSNTETTTSTQQDGKSNFMAFAKFAVEQGWIKPFDEKEYDGSLEGFNEMMNAARNADFESGINEYKSTITTFRQRIEDALESGVAEKDIVNHFKTVKDLERIDKTKLAENEDQLRKLYTMYYKATTKFSDEKIKKEIDKKIEVQDIDDAADVYDEYNKHLLENEKAMKEAAEKAEQDEEKSKIDTLNTINKYIDESKEIAGVKVTPQLREKFKKEFQANIRTKDGNDVRPVVATRMKNPLEFDVAVSMLHALGLLNIDDKGKWSPDLSKIKTNLKSSVTLEMEKEFGNGVHPKTGKPLEIGNLSGDKQEQVKAIENFLNTQF